MSSVLTLNPPNEYNKTKKSFKFDVFEIYLFSKTGSLIAENIFRKNIYNFQNRKNILPNFIKTLAIQDKKKNKAINHNIFFLNEAKIVTVNIETSNIISIAICSKNTKSQLIYFFLLKITMAFLNYMKMHNCNTSYNIHSIIFETILLSPIINHFTLAIKEIFRRYTLYFNNIRYKNYYLVDLCSNEIILSLETLYNQNSNDIVEMKIPTKIIWNEILYHAHILKRDYMKINNNIFQIENLQDFYVKIEFKATYPRLIYIIKFLPILGGMVLIHEYIQTKMSRIDIENKGYQELEYDYGYQFGEDNNFQTKNYEVLLNEPDVLIHIHFYIIECLLCNLNNIGFFIFNKYNKIYFTDEIIKIINKQIYSNIKFSQATEICKDQQAVNQLLEKIANSLYEEYIQIDAQVEESKESSMIKRKNIDEISLSRSFYISYPDSLYITKKFTLNTIFKSGQLNKYINPNDLSLNLSSEEEENPITDNIYQTLREKNEFNQFNDPYFYYRYHYANASVESRQLMDLLNDNISISENEILLNIQKNKIKNLSKLEKNDLMSGNITDLSSRRNASINNLFKPYITTTNYNNNIAQFNYAQDIYNPSSNSSQIRPMIKLGK